MKDENNNQIIGDLKLSDTKKLDKFLTELIRDEKQYDSNSKCKECIKKSICRYCPGRFYLETGSFKEKSNWYCDMAEKIIESFKKSINNQDFEEMFNILTENMKTYNKQLIIKENDFEDWKNNIIKNEKLNTYTVKENNKVIGYIQYIKEGNLYCICEIQIQNEKQKDKKTFRKLISYFIDVCDINDNNIIYCNINPNNLNSISVFTGIGFKKTIKNRYEISGDKFLEWFNKN